MELETKRLILSPWNESEAELMYQYAKDPAIGPIAGWPAHQSVEESLQIIRLFNTKDELYAIRMKPDGIPIGTIQLKLAGDSDLVSAADECELGYWLGKPYWGQGIMPEAAQELLRHAFEDCGMSRVWCGHYEGNLKSRRVMEKCGMHFRWKSEGVDVPLMHEKRDGYVFCIEKEEWESQKTK